MKTFYIVSYVTDSHYVTEDSWSFKDKDEAIRFAKDYDLEARAEKENANSAWLNVDMFEEGEMRDDIDIYSRHTKWNWLEGRYDEDDEQ